MRRRLFLILCLGLLVFAPSAGAKKAPHWAQPEIKAVVAHGLLATTVPAFRPDDPVTQGELTEALALLRETDTRVPANAGSPVTMAQLDAQVVAALGLKDSAYRFYRAVSAAGLKPPSRFGTETVARLLGLRFNHPAETDALELGPNDPATRAEAAYTLARVLELDENHVQWIKDASLAFQLPAYTPWQRTVLATGVSLVGLPYVWGGESESATDGPYGPQAAGGFDCSGFAWRIFKLQPYAGGEALAGVFRGRTSMAMSGEVPAKLRIKAKDLQPADVLFFGAKGPKSKPAQVDHVAVYLGNGWLVESSRQGVALGRLDDWRLERLAWARRPLAEAALTA
jgi:cell wall-associated NlpC family hydrolase